MQIRNLKFVFGLIFRISSAKNKPTFLALEMRLRRLHATQLRNLLAFRELAFVAVSVFGEKKQHTKMRLLL